MSIATVLGSGNWGTTFAKVMADAGHQVRIWGRDPKVCRDVNDHHRNERYLPGIALPDSLSATTDVRAAMQDADAVVVALPSQIVRAQLTELRASFPAEAITVSLMKGVELGTLQRMSQVMAEALAIDFTRVAVISGPNLAGEIAEQQPTATVVAAAQLDVAKQVAGLCANPYFRPYTNTDVIGVELGGAVKNVIALAVGIAQGTGAGDNTKATIITRGLVETARLGVALGADPETFSGLAGMGDLVATCASPLSRNRQLGVRIGQGLLLDEAIAETGQTVEGVNSCRSVLELAATVGVEMPITAAVVGVLHKGLPVSEMASLLLNRPHRSEGLR